MGFISDRQERRRIDNLGRMWNAQPCRCTICNKEFKSIKEGEAHVYVIHNKLWNETRKYIEKI